MHHLYPSVKGDPLCPLGFHPQVRWPTRCKRCFRDYKEHGGRKRDDDIPLRREDVTASSPSLSIGSSASRSRDDGRSREEDTSSSGRSWTSSQNLSVLSNVPEPISKPKRPASWTSTPDLGHLNDDTKADVTVSLSLPRRRLTAELNDTGQNSESYTMRRPPQSPSSKTPVAAPVVETITINKNDTLAERVKKMQAIKRQGSLERESSKERETPTSKKEYSTKRDAATEPPKRISVKEVRTKVEQPTNHDVQFLIQVKNKSNSKKISKSSQSSRRSGSGTESSDDDTISIAGTETTETTLVDKNESELYEQIESLKQELEATRARCERAERDKSDILLRRLAAMDTTPSRTSASEMLKLQQKVNELKGQSEELRDEKKSLSLRVRELECELAARPTHATEEVLRNKLQAAETLCEELMDENEDMKRELRSLEDEIDEMTDNYREEQVDEYAKIKKDLEATNKNSRVLSFKLKKAEKRLEVLEAERLAFIGGGDLVQKIRQLEQELSVANEVARRLQEELDCKDSGKTKKKAPLLGNIGKSSSAEGKVSRESLTRGGSQEDPVQLLRDLQDSLEREADLREQLRFAEEEAQNLRKKASRVEDDNESLVMQLKKMATKARTRKLSPTAPTNRLTPEPPVEKDEGISDEEDPAELRLLLELNEQEASVLRRKVEDLETESETAKRQVRELTERLASKSGPTKRSFLPTGKGSTLADQKMKVLEDEASELRKKLVEKERDYERLHAELNFAQRKPKGSLAKSKSLDGSGDQQSLDLRRQLQVVEQEAAVLRTRTQKLEVDNDKLSAENKKLQLQSLRTTVKRESSEKTDEAKTKFDAKTAAADAEKLKNKDTEINKLKQSLTKIETERDTLQMKLKTLKDDAATVFPPRTPKRPTDMTTKLQMKKMVEELEAEIGDLVVVLRNAGANKVTTLEGEKKKLYEEIKDLKNEIVESRTEIKSLEAKRDEASLQQTKQSAKVGELEKKLKTSEEALTTSQKALTASKENATKTEKKLSEQMEQCKKLETAQKLTLSEKTALESKIKALETNLKQEKDKAAAIPKNTGPTPEMIKLMKERDAWESQVSDMEHDLQLSRKEIENLKTKHEKEMVSLKARSNPISAVKKTQDLQDRVEKLESTLSTERKSYDELTAKYEILEEEHVVTKAQLTMEKEALQSQISSSQNITTAKDSEIKKLKDSHVQQINNWEKEKSNLEDIIKDLEEKVSRGNAIELERSRLKANLEDRVNDLEQSKRESEMLSDQMDYLRKENDELRKKLDDYDKVNKVQRNMTADSSAMEQEIKQLKSKLDQADKLRKSDIANCKLRYDGQVTTLNEELQSLQNQVQRFKREKDTFKQMLDSAQKTISDLKNQPSSGRQSRNSLSSEDTEESRMKLASLEQQVGCMEDELCEARLEASKLKTELVSERSAWEIKLSEMQSRVNELEEDRLLASGRLKVSGMKTRMELAWSREREEQQRLLQETSKLARDLRQTLFEVERERDKERLESKRKLEQVKKTTEEEQEENRKKVTELQCDLLELRDAHAKLRTTNEKLRREKERHDRERDDLRGAASYRRRFDQDGERKVGALLDQVEELVKIAPELQKTTPGQSQTQTNLLTPTPPRRSKVRSRPNSRQHSRESTPGDERSSSPTAQLAHVLARLADASEELRKFQKISEEDRDRDRARRTLGIRRAASTEHDNTDTSSRGGSAPRSISRGTPHNGSLHRKSLSLSLDQGPQHENIWKADDDSLSSMQSLDAEADSRYYSMKRDTSLDSRLSGGSTQSDVLPSGKKKKTGLMGKLKKLTKSRSIDDHSGSAEFSVSSTVNSQHQGSDSDMSVTGDHRSSKKDLKGRITGMFKKSGSSSRSNSTERVSKPIGTPLPERNDSTQRPLARNGSNSNLLRPVGPARPPSSAAATPAAQRRAK